MTELLAADEKAYQIAGYQLYVSQICVMDPPSCTAARPSWNKPCKSG